MKADRTWGLVAAGMAVLGVILGRMVVKHRAATKQLERSNTKNSDT